MTDKIDLPILKKSPLSRIERKLRKKSYINSEYHRKRCVFIHIPKNAGTSVKKTLFGDVRITHRLAMDYYLDDPKSFNNYFTFAFSRNPYDRVVSAYHYLIQGGKNQADKSFRDQYLNRYDSFRDFIMRGIGQKEIMQYWHFMPQYFFVVDYDGNCMIDFIGRFENLASDFSEVSKRLGMDVMLPALNQSDRNDYRSFYTPELVDRVKEIYAKDFEIFDYSKSL